jgi:membrane-bound metal-dependent hydrolase YbcI (DUF457 family)
MAFLAVGLLFHLVRDLATGPGVPLLWPFGHPVLMPYSVYVVVLVVAAIAAVLRSLSRSVHDRAAVQATAPERAAASGLRVPRTRR